MTRYDVIKAELVIDLDGDTWEYIYLPLLEKMELHDDSINSLVDNLTIEEINFICNSMRIDKNYFTLNEANKVFCMYWFIKKLMILNLEGLDCCETVMSYMDSLARLVKDYYFPN